MNIEPPTKLPKKKCLIYARVSSAKQKSDGAGLSSQERICRQYAECNGYEVVEVFTDVISGRSTDRPGINALLASLQDADTANCVVVDEISRVARDLPVLATLRDKITSSGATIESASQKLADDEGTL